ncbi:MAG: hypothetical protein ACFN4A_08400 [Streptococcus mutans]|uniref:hypothetical protein n=1 Tax=Streptococcus TaxID=1301 RepID=UPI000451B6E6|nr:MULTISPECIES: hypothetical protein [Streptococcus]EUB25720.1 hypothetical protein HMPREF1514_1804 [Streptococcus sp. AS20]MDX5014674.1 hypothetical protein [Streptococcus anginosus]MDX5018751.1 hypothetical protein [Streptococcus anginosus]RSJ19981.1 hypothetical protein D8829_05810 [Streptococcus intermedius]
MKMLDMDKLKRVKVIGLVVGAVLLLLIGYGIGASGKNTSSNPSSKENKTTTIKSEKTKELTQKQVKNFLVSYYTKKDLSENRNRYKEYMTDAMYNQETSTEDEATNQAYKGYVVDYIFKEAEIYIDTKNKVAIAKVRYTNTLLAKKNNYEKAQKNVSNESTLRLTYVQQNNKLLVNKKESILLVSNTESNSDYPNYGTATSNNGTTANSDKTK